MAADPVKAALEAKGVKVKVTVPPRLTLQGMTLKALNELVVALGEKPFDGKAAAVTFLLLLPSKR